MGGPIFLILKSISLFAIFLKIGLFGINANAQTLPLIETYTVSRLTTEKGKLSVAQNQLMLDFIARYNFTLQLKSHSSLSKSQLAKKAIQHILLIEEQPGQKLTSNLLPLLSQIDEIFATELEPNEDIPSLLVDFTLYFLKTPQPNLNQFWLDRAYTSGQHSTPARPLASEEAASFLEQKMPLSDLEKI